MTRVGFLEPKTDSLLDNLRSGARCTSDSGTLVLLINVRSLMKAYR
jgi:hypothetical protein